MWDVSERIVRIYECEVEVSGEKPVELQEAPIERVEEEVIEEVLGPIETKEKADSSSSSSSSEDEQAIKYANEETILIDDDDQQQSEQVAQDIIVEKPVDVPVEEKKVEPEVIQKAAEGDLRDAARLMAQSELNKEDLTEEEIFNLLQKSSEEEIKSAIHSAFDVQTKKF